MGALSWGLLGPETLASERRTRTLGLAATVRSFNDLAGRLPLIGDGGSHEEIGAFVLGGKQNALIILGFWPTSDP